MSGPTAQLVLHQHPPLKLGAREQGARKAVPRIDPETDDRVGNKSEEEDGHHHDEKGQPRPKSLARQPAAPSQPLEAVLELASRAPPVVPVGQGRGVPPGLQAALVDVLLRALARARADQAAELRVLGDVAHAGLGREDAAGERVVEVGGGIDDLEADAAGPGLVVPLPLCRRRARGRLGWNSGCAGWLLVRRRWCLVVALVVVLCVHSRGPAPLRLKRIGSHLEPGS